MCVRCVRNVQYGGAFRVYVFVDVPSGNMYVRYVCMYARYVMCCLYAWMCVLLCYVCMYACLLCIFIVYAWCVCVYVCCMVVICGMSVSSVSICTVCS